jgi:hypothetical protein
MNEYEPPTPTDGEDFRDNFEQNYCSECGEEIEKRGLALCQDCEERYLLGDKFGGV